MGADTVPGLSARAVRGRRYRLLALLGEGGFGRVYKARLEDDQGFSKVVAVKIGDADAPEPVLKRFRDEARILGLVRDRAIVNVEPPTRIGDRWAVVMEYVEGASLRQLLAARTRLPPKVALEVVQEIARALDSVYAAPGPDGAPLQLVHRDLKPGNVQLTAAGEVKILDFGLARARFQGREADSTTNIGGTLGYIAPERLEGIESDRGDIYSLGILLRTLVTGIGPIQWRERVAQGNVPDDGDIRQVLGLVERMIAADPAQRPSAAEVEEQCAAWVAAMRGPTLRSWCREFVRAPSGSTRDRMVGSLLSETLASVPVGVEDSRNLTRPRSRAWLVVASIGSVGTGILAVLAIAAVVLAGLLAVRGAADRRARDEVDIADVLPPPREPEPIVIEVPEPEPEVRPAPRRYEVAFTSEPRGAEVWVDGKRVGTTPVSAVPLAQGDHDLRMVFGFERIEARIRVGPNGPVSYLWEVGEPLQVSY